MPVDPSDYRATFGSASGQQVLEELWTQFWGDTVMFAPGMPALDLAFREGQRSVIVMLKSIVDDAMKNTDNPPSTYGDPIYESSYR